MVRFLFLYGEIATKGTMETLAPNLIGIYVGHTRKSVQEKMEEARGGVLLIDKVYELGKGSFGDEELLNNLTLPEFMDKNTVVILRGYGKDMHKMLKKNIGIKSRFTSYVKFKDMRPGKCASIVSGF